MREAPPSISAAGAAAVRQRPSAGEVMSRHRGAGPGFDWLRLGLSLAVILLHSFHTAYGYRPGASLAQGAAGPVFAAILPMFFGLSGFLVTGSALRTRNLKVFLSFRVLRIVPALLTEVTLSALLLGAVMTTLPLADYFTDRRFLVYFGNVVGWIHMQLPGVFDANPRSGIVNQNLWTLHPELFSYAVMAAMMATALAYDRRRLTIVWGVLTLALAVINIATGWYEPRGVYPSLVLIYAFVTGVVAFHWRDKIPVDGRLAVLAAVVAYALHGLPEVIFLVLFAHVYLMIWLGMQTFPRIGWLQTGDYSYGLYLYAFPVQQTLVALVPLAREWYWNFLLTVPITLVIAMLSWRFVEKPALALKRYVRAAPGTPVVDAAARTP